MNQDHVRHAWDSATIFLFALFLAGLFMMPATPVSGQTLSDYTAYPPFLADVVPPNILFMVDMGTQTVEASYGGPNHHYPISFKAGTWTDFSRYASNVTWIPPIPSAANPILVAVSPGDWLAIPGPTTAAPIDRFDPSLSYYGMFDPLRCYVTNANSFIYGAVKAAVTTACAVTQWDGNFLNWLTMRKKDVSYQAFVGGSPKPAQANSDGTANSLAGENTTGENGAAAKKCASMSATCWRYIKFVPDADLAGRVPTALPNPTVVGNNWWDWSLPDAGRWFGSGEGLIYVNDDATANPFDTAAANKYAIQVDMTTEPDIPAGTGSHDDHCNVGEAGYAGHLVCYKRDRSLGLFQTLQLDDMHVGVMFVNALSGQASKMQFDFDEGFNAASVTGIRNEHIQTHSPISEALYEALCLFRKSQGPCYNNSGQSATGYTTATGVAGDPYWFDDLSTMVSCCKSFVLMISPGGATSDGNSPDLQAPFGDLFTDADNWGIVSTGAAGDQLDDVAYYGNTNDIRDQGAASPVGVDGNQNVTFYAVNSMGTSTGAALLSSAAKYGGFKDEDGDNLPDATGQTCTYPAGSLLGSGASVSSSEWDKNKDCVPDTYFEASAGENLTDQVNRAIAAILQEASAGSAASVIASSSTGEGALYQSFFFPSTFEGANEITWTGHTQGLFLDAFGNLREDTNGDAILTYEDDQIIKSRFDTGTSTVIVERYNDADANGLADTATPVSTTNLKGMNPIWEAGDRLAQTASSARKIITVVDLDNDGVVDAGDQIDFTTTNAATLAPYLRPGTAPFTANNIINFTRGDQIAGMRDRQLTVGGSLKVWKLSDAIHSQPIVAGAPAQRYDIVYGDTTYNTFFTQYKDRRQVAYLGANDGMLHAFNAGYFHRGDDPSTTSKTEHGWFTRTPTDNSGGKLLGEELFGFIPKELLPHLKWLTRPDYTHVYYADLTPKVTDARIFTADSVHPGGWGTILIGGFRLGGSCGQCVIGTGAPPMTVTADFNYDGDTVDAGDTRTFYSAYFVLDVTDPEDTASYGKPLWSFSNGDLGLTTSAPSMLRVNPAASAKTDNTDAKWYLIAASGPTGYSGIAGQAGTMYAIDLATGPGANNSNVVTLPAETLNAFMGNTLTVDLDFDYRVDTTYLGSAIDDGAAPWRGKLYRLTTNTCTAPCSANDWGIDVSGQRMPTEILDTFPASNALELGPVLPAPAVTIDDASKVWVFAGTGRFFNDADKVTTEQQYFVGVKDSVMNLTCTQSSTTSCHDNDLVNVSSAQVCIVGTGNCGTTTDQVTGVTGVTDFPSLINLVATKDGWYTTLPDSGERVLARPLVFGGLVFFPTFTPSVDICNSAGTSKLYGLYYKTGSAYSSPVMGTTGATTKFVNRSTTMGTGMATEAVVHLGTGSAEGEAGVFTQNSLGQLVRLEVTTTGGITSRLLSWWRG